MDAEKIATITRLIQECQQHEYIIALAEDGPLTVEQIDAGYLNYVCRVRSADGSKSCFVKVYLDYAKFMGPAMPMDTERCQREYLANHFFRSLFPDCCPEHYFCDEEHHIGFLKDYPEHIEWGRVLLTKSDLHSGAKVADMLVTIHSSTHRGKLTASQFDDLCTKFRAFPKQVNFLCQAQFVKPLSVNHRSYKPHCNPAVRCRVDEVIRQSEVIKAAESAKEWMSVENGDCCIHGDMHLENIFYSMKDCNIMLIDTDCTRVGPEAYDVGLLVSNYILLYHYHQKLSRLEVESSEPNHTQLMNDMWELITITMTRYMDGMRQALPGTFDGPVVWRQILVFIALEIIGWISGPASFDYIDKQPEVMLQCLDTALLILCHMPKDMIELSHHIFSQ